MANTYELIQAQVLGSSAATVTFSSIPATYTDLLLKVLVRRDASGRQDLRLAVNGSTTDGSNIFLQLVGTATTSGISSAQYVRINNVVPSTAETSNTFGSVEFYIPNYLASRNKPISISGVGEQNATQSLVGQVASLYSQTTAISSLALSLATGSFVTNSSFYLYGVKNT